MPTTLAITIPVEREARRLLGIVERGELTLGRDDKPIAACLRSLLARELPADALATADKLRRIAALCKAWRAVGDVPAAALDALERILEAP
jgi:hypothetical protein